jgi:hypothetical protein
MAARYTVFSLDRLCAGSLGRVTRMLAAAVLMTAAIGPLPVPAQDEDAAATEEGTAATEEGAAETYARLRAEAELSARHNAHVERLLVAQATDIAALESEIQELDGLPAALGPLLERMHRELADFVAADAPFLRGERMERLDRIDQLLAQEGNVSEKFRRLLEAMQIELEYGRTLGTYSGVLDDGRPAEFVNVGRVALLYRTVDGRESGYWDRAAGAWTVSDDYDREIRDALAMAKEEIAPDLLVLPIPAASEEGR